MSKGMTLKLYMRKAYDGVKLFLSWGEKMMQNLGINEQWIAKIMKCISTVAYIYINVTNLGIFRTYER